jgi:membrane protease YdiL (CAAX protease family)
MSPLGTIFIIIVCLVMPVLAMRAARQLESRRLKPSVHDILMSTIVTHGTVGILAVLAARANGVVLFPAPTFRWTDAAAGAAFLVLASLANLLRWRVMSDAEREHVSWLRPQSRRDLAAWAAISLVAGVAEEVIYRGTLFGLVHQMVDSYWASVGACVFVFALGHWVQGRGAMVIIVIFAAAFHVLVRLTGDLYTAIVVHVVYDFAAGMLLWRLSAGAR